MNRLEALLARRLETRYDLASDIVERILEDARAHAVDIMVVGSLAKGDFRAHSDIDLLVRGSAEPARRLLVERLVAGHLRGTGLPYDLLFEADLTAEGVNELLGEEDTTQSLKLQGSLNYLNV